MKTAPPRKAMLLAAGLGTRMRPLTYACPKPMLPLWGLPLIEHTLRLLAEWGVEEALVNLHHAPTPLLEYLRHRPKASPRVVLSFEPTILGTGGAIRRAAWFLDEEPFWLINTDIAADVDPQPFLDAFTPGLTYAALWVTPDRGPRTVSVDNAGNVIAFRALQAAAGREAPAGARPSVTFCGLHLLAPAILRYLPDDGPASIIAAYEAAMRDGIPIPTVTPRNAYWNDLGTPERYLAAHAEVRQRHAGGAPGKRLYTVRHVMSPAMLRRRGVRVDGFAAVSRDAVLARGARLRDSVVWAGAQLSATSSATRAIIGGGTVLDLAADGPVVRLADCPADAVPTRAARRFAEGRTGQTLVMPLAARGSDRTFTRLARGTHSAILIRYGRERRENARHVHHAGALSHYGIPVPAIFDHDPRQRYTLEQDLGDQSLERLIAQDGARQRRERYRRVIAVTARLHAIPLGELAGKLEPAFDRRLYRWEHELFDTHLLQGRLGLTPAQRKAIRADLRGVAGRLATQPHVLVHRDLQSSNVLIRDGQPYLIDFQGMRAGPAAYDLASLLCDPYTMLPPSLQRQLLTEYAARRPRAAVSAADFWVAAVQRLAQALGAYARLAAMPATSRFAACIPPACAMLERAVTACRPHIELPHLRELLASIPQAKSNPCMETNRKSPANS
jgi:N-acetylmuramate 1-kinase